MSERILFIAVYVIGALVLGLSLYKMIELLIAYFKPKEGYNINDVRNSFDNRSNLILNEFLPFYTYKTQDYQDEQVRLLCRSNFNSQCSTGNEAINAINNRISTQVGSQLSQFYLNLNNTSKNDLLKFGSQSLTLADNNKITKMYNTVSPYITRDLFDQTFTFIYPSSSNERNIYLWQLQMSVYLSLVDFLYGISQTGGKFTCKRLKPIISLKVINKSLTAIHTGYTYENFTIDLSTNLNNLLFYVPNGLWTNEFKILMSLYNGLKVENFVNQVVTHPTTSNSNFINNNEIQNNVLKGMFIPIVSPSTWFDLMLGSVNNGNTEHSTKILWNSGWSVDNFNSKTMKNAYGQVINLPISTTVNPSLSQYKSYLFNSLCNNILDTVNPISSPESLLDKNFLVTQSISLRKQDLNRRLNLHRKDLFTLNGCNREIARFKTMNNNNLDGFTGHLTRMRENIIDCVLDYPNPTPSGWFFVILNSLRPIVSDFPKLVIDNKISPESLLNIKRIEGSVKPVTNPTVTPPFGQCRPVTKCRSCRSDCNQTNCGDLRAHAAVDFYGNENDSVYSTYYGIVIGIEKTFFTDLCSQGGSRDSSCQSGFTCNSKDNCVDSKGNVFKLPAVIIKHIDGTIGRYGEFPLLDTITIGKELKTGESIGNIILNTLQCHFEIYAGTADIIPWAEGGYPFVQINNRNLQNIENIKNIYIDSLTVAVTPPRNLRNPNILNYKYVKSPNYCIASTCKYNCAYKRRCDLLNANKTVDFGQDTSSITQDEEQPQEQPQDTQNCNINGTPGICTESIKCTVSPTSGLCSGPSNIKCCPKNKIAQTCNINGTEGICTNVANCSTIPRSGLCSGAANIKCCPTTSVRL